jgi:LemA protein
MHETLNSLSRSAKIWLALGIVVLILGVWSIGKYNTLVGLDEQVKTSQGDIESDLQRRFDLIPNLVESVKGTLKQEQEVFGKIADARSRYAGAQAGSPEKIAAANEVQSALARLLVIMENYPELKSAETVQSLMSQLEGTENRISVSRKRFNESVNALNVAIRDFPGNIIASLFGFEKKERFEAVEGAQKAPKVDLEVK